MEAVLGGPAGPGPPGLRFSPRCGRILKVVFFSSGQSFYVQVSGVGGWEGLVFLFFSLLEIFSEFVLFYLFVFLAVLYK